MLDPSRLELLEKSLTPHQTMLTLRWTYLNRHDLRSSPGADLSSCPFCGVFGFGRHNTNSSAAASSPFGTASSSRSHVFHTFPPYVRHSHWIDPPQETLYDNRRYGTTSTTTANGRLTKDIQKRRRIEILSPEHADSTGPFTTTVNHGKEEPHQRERRRCTWTNLATIAYRFGRPFIFRMSSSRHHLVKVFPRMSSLLFRLGVSHFNSHG